MTPKLLGGAFLIQIYNIEPLLGWAIETTKVNTVRQKEKHLKVKDITPTKSGLNVNTVSVRVNLVIRDAIAHVASTEPRTVHISQNQKLQGHHHRLHCCTPNLAPKLVSTNVFWFLTVKTNFNKTM